MLIKEKLNEEEIFKHKLKRGGKYHEMHGYLINLNWVTKDHKYYNMKGVTEINYPYPKIGFESIKNIITIKNVNLSFLTVSEVQKIIDSAIE